MAIKTDRQHTERRPPQRGSASVSFLSGLLAGSNGMLAQRERLSRLAGTVWIIFLVSPIVELFQRPFSPLHRGFTLLGVAVFLAVFLILSLAPPPPDAAITPNRCFGIAALYVLAIVLSLTGGAPWLSLFYYCEGALGWLSPRTTARGVVATIALVFVLARVLDGDLAQAGITAAQTALIGLLVLGLFQMIRTNAALSAAREEIARLAVAEERLRFARDLHDLLGHSLSLIALKSELAGQLVHAAPERATREIADIERVAREALREVREAVMGYRQSTLATELASVRAVLDAAGIASEIDDTVGALPAAVDAVLAWTVREGVTNVVRHSRARRCRIAITREADRAVIEITDDGRGSDPNDKSAATGTGLAGLRERVAMRGGQLAAGPAAAGGFRVRVAIPLTAEVAG